MRICGWCVSSPSAKLVCLLCDFEDSSGGSKPTSLQTMYISLCVCIFICLFLSFFLSFFLSSFFLSFCVCVCVCILYMCITSLEISAVNTLCVSPIPSPSSPEWIQCWGPPLRSLRWNSNEGFQHSVVEKGIPGGWRPIEWGTLILYRFRMV